MRDCELHSRNRMLSVKKHPRVPLGTLDPYRPRATSDEKSTRSPGNRVT